MLRLVIDDAGQLWPDLLQKAPGRGTYLCMQETCLGNLSDKRLGPLRSKMKVHLPQAAGLQSRLIEALDKWIRQSLTKQKASAAVGRDAVMHQMWKNAPLLVILADDAGDALVRQVTDAAEKRSATSPEGKGTAQTGILRGYSSAYLAELFDRDKVSVVSLVHSAQLAKLMQISAWYRRLKGSR